MNNQIPKEKGLDHTFNLLTEGYLFIQNRCRRFHTNIFETSLFMKPAICMKGEEAAQLFYDEMHFERKNAVPKRIQKTLLGENGVQTLDREAHHHRKALFLSFMTKEQLEHLVKLTEKQLELEVNKWKNKNELIIFDAMQELLCQVACEWTGVPLKEEEITLRADDFGKMVDALGGIGPRYWQGRKARIRTDLWIETIIDQIRNHEIEMSEEKAAYQIAFHRDLNDQLLDTHTASVELINLLRPIVAIATYITFGVLALYEHPKDQEYISEKEDETYLEMFVQEIRRYYPFGPFVGARVKDDFKWKEYYFKKGTLVLLDIYGTNHDANLWEKPNQFYPKHFENWDKNPFSFIPQGGGDDQEGHRCAGEWVTVEVMKTILKFLSKEITYQVPAQDLSYSLIRIPTRPKSGFKIENIQS
jgi:fatty-acid peroxygenase